MCTWRDSCLNELEKDVTRSRERSYVKASSKVFYSPLANETIKNEIYLSNKIKKPGNSTWSSSLFSRLTLQGGH